MSTSNVEHPTARRASFKWRWVLGTVAMVVALVALQIGAQLTHLPGWEAWLPPVAVLAAGLMLAVYGYWRGKITGAPPADLPLSRLVPHFLTGLAIGAGLQALTFLSIALVAQVHITGPNPPGVIVPMLADALETGVFEEIIARGLLFAWLEARWGSKWALVISALIFGGMHFANPGFSPVAAVGLSAAGVLLGAAYMAARSLWFPIALHAGWNFTESGIFGASMSGHGELEGLFNTQFDGAPLLTGGTFGPEASLTGVIVVALGAAAMVAAAARRGQFRPGRRAGQGAPSA